MVNSSRESQQKRQPGKGEERRRNGGKAGISYLSSFTEAIGSNEAQKRDTELCISLRRAGITFPEMRRKGRFGVSISIRVKRAF